MQTNKVMVQLRIFNAVPRSRRLPKTGVNRLLDDIANGSQVHKTYETHMTGKK